MDDYAEHLIRAQQCLAQAHQAILDKRYKDAAFQASRASTEAYKVETWALMQIKETEVVG